MERINSKYTDENLLKDKDILEKLRLLNNKLFKIENETMLEVDKLNKELRKRLRDKDDWLEDYEIELEINIYVDKNDPEFKSHLEKDDFDGLLSTFTLPFSANKKNDERIILTDGGENHNDFTHWKWHPMYGEFHCYFFHHLYDHEYLSWEDILRIGTFWVDITVIHQKKYNLNNDFKPNLIPPSQMKN